jgi:hypothetical protein
MTKLNENIFSNTTNLFEPKQCKNNQVSNTDSGEPFNQVSNTGSGEPFNQVSNTGSGEPHVYLMFLNM